jgi:Rne/Rng family ribonuclease
MAVTEEILINVTPQETRVAVIEQGVTQEVHVERASARGMVGNIYMGRVIRVLPGMQSAFVDIGTGRDAFLHAADVFEELPENLLTPEEQVLFARLGVFAGGCTLDDVQAVCSDGLNVDIGDGLEALINNSLISQTQSITGEPRFMLLETMREYALEKLAEQGELERVQRTHAALFVALAETAGSGESDPSAPRSYCMKTRFQYSR